MMTKFSLAKCPNGIAITQKEIHTFFIIVNKLIDSFNNTINNIPVAIFNFFQKI